MTAQSRSDAINNQQEKYIKWIKQESSIREYHRKIGIFVFLYSLTKDKTKNIFGTTESSTIPVQRNIILHGQYGLNDCGYSIVDINSGCFDPHYNNNQELGALIKRLLEQLKGFDQLSLLQNEEANELFEAIGKFFIKFSTVDGFIGFLYQNCEIFEPNKLENPRSPLTRLKLILPKDQNRDPRVLMLTEINSLRTRIKDMELREVEEIKHGINLCDDFLNLLHGTEEKYEYVFADPNSEIGKAAMNKAKVLKH